MEIEVMYTERDHNGRFKRKRAPVSHAHTLPREGVLFIILSEFHPEKQIWRRIAEAWEHPRSRVRNHPHGGDGYALIETPTQVMLTGWVDEQWKWLPKHDPFREGKRKSSMGPPAWESQDGITITKFRGALCPMDLWDQALEQFKEMH